MCKFTCYVVTMSARLSIRLIFATYTQSERGLGGSERGRIRQRERERERERERGCLLYYDFFSALQGVKNEHSYVSHVVGSMIC